MLAASTAAAAPAVEFARDVQPLLSARCVSCHGGEKPQAGLSLESLAGIRKGGQSGPAIAPGSSRDSILIQRVTGFAAPVMPFGQEPLTERQIETLRAWVDQQTPGAISDAVFARRAHLDLWGLVPTPEQLDEFLGDPRPDKRERLIDRLLAGSRNYSEHWISFWNDLLRNDEGVVYHGARQSISPWLLRSLENNVPYHRFVQALLNPKDPGDPQGFLLGVNWRGDVSASQTPPMQAAQNSAQVFLGVNLKCNSCHDSFISRWKLKDAYGLASFFADQQLEIFRCDVATGEKSHPKFLFGGEEIPAGATPEERRAAAARWFTSDPRLARTLVNRFWKKLLGRGLVEPVDEMDNPPSDPALLEELASDFAARGYDLKLLLRRIMTSRQYQLPPTEARRMTAEQYVDSISSITGEWRLQQPSKPGVATPSREWRLKSSPLTRALGRPIRDQVFTGRSQEATTLQALELVNGDTLSRLLHQGARRLLGEWKQPPANVFDSGVVRTERIPVDLDVSGLRKLWLLIEDADSYDRSRVIAGWLDAELVSSGGVTRLAEPARQGVPSEIVLDLAGKGYTRFRATVAIDKSSHQSDISPRARFFAFAEQPDRDHLVRLAETEPPPPAVRATLVSRLYRHALSREPAAEERRLAEELLGAGSEGLEDLLWSLFLSPEFQYVE